MKNQIDERSWDEFRETKLLWFVNTILHAFGWAIVVEKHDAGYARAYPARVKFRGFPESDNTEGYRGLSHYMHKYGWILEEEADE